MSSPRPIVPNVTYLVTRRCAQRQFFLKPSRTTNDVFLYVLAVAAERYGILVHAVCVLSNHYHLVVTDPNARLPAFHQFLDALVARALNAALGRSEAFWDPSSYSAVALATPEAIVDKTAYVIANPTAAGLVRTGEEWPGIWLGPQHVAKGPIVVERPSHFFDPNGSMPATATLVITAPPGFSVSEFQRLVGAEVAAREELAARQHGGAFLGVARVLSQRPTGRPTTPEQRGRLNPTVAAKDKWKRIEALARLAGFVASYRAAWRAWHSGKRDIVFPAGTYLMRVLHGVPCASPA